MFDPTERDQMWRSLNASARQRKLYRRGGFLGAAKGTYQPRELALHAESLTYRTRMARTTAESPFPTSRR